MNSQVVRFTIFALIALGLAACGKSKPTAAEGTIDQTAASSLASGSGKQAVITLASPKPDATTFGSSSVASTGRGLDLIPEYRNIKRFLDRETCTPTSSDTTDADADGIPKGNIMSFNCNTTESGFTVTASGSISITDTNDGDKNSGFTFKVDNVKFTLTLGARVATTIEAVQNGEFTVSVAAPTITATGSISIVVSAGGKTITIGYWADSTATGTSASDPFAAGTITVDNWYKYEYDSKKFTLHITGESLTYGACTREDEVKLNGGKLKIVDGVPNTIEVSFNAACDATWTYNGTAL